jgi:hypothetical protein
VDGKLDIGCITWDGQGDLAAIVAGKGGRQCWDAVWDVAAGPQHGMYGGYRELLGRYARWTRYLLRSPGWDLGWTWVPRVPIAGTQRRL